MLVAVLLAAGASERAGEDKILADLGGTPLLLWSACRLVAEPRVDALLVVARPDVLRDVEDTAGGLRKLMGVIPGGRDRAASARAGLAAARDAGQVLVHDGARPFVDAATVTRVLDALAEDGAAAAALPVADTLRHADGTWAGETLDRTGVWAMQTPQAFEREALADAYARATRTPTDCAAAARAAGVRVRLVRGDPLNFKVTTAEDLALARALVAAGALRPAGVPGAPS